MTSYKRGNIVLVLFPDSNLQTAKKRPALIVQADNLQTIQEKFIDKVIGNLPSMDKVGFA
jgi:mRNA interferase MazF